MRAIAFAIPLAVVTLAAACSSSSSGAHDGGIVDVALGEAESEMDATVADASEEEDAASSPVYTCDEAQLAYATTMACGQCVAMKCAKYLLACTNCITCQQMLGSGCPACAAMCFAGGPGPGPGGPVPGFPVDAGLPVGSE